MKYLRIPCTNTRRNGSLCNGTVGFVEDGTRDMHYISHPCIACRAMSEVRIKNGELSVKITKKFLKVENYPFFVSQGVYRK